MQVSRFITLRSDLLLLIAAIIWGFAFVAQRMGMEDIGPFLFNAIRFAMGAGVLVLVVKVRDIYSGEERKRGSGEAGKTLKREEDKTLGNEELSTADRRLPNIYGLLLGLILFAGATFQQTGIVFTTAGNAGFITGLYLIVLAFFCLILCLIFFL